MEFVFLIGDFLGDFFIFFFFIFFFRFRRSNFFFKIGDSLLLAVESMFSSSFSSSFSLEEFPKRLPSSLGTFVSISMGSGLMGRGLRVGGGRFDNLEVGGGCFEDVARFEKVGALCCLRRRVVLWGGEGALGG